jgi:predicted transposase YbfD/YdcC
MCCTARCNRTTEQKHDRQTEREYPVWDLPYDLPDRSRWSKSKAIGTIVNTTIRDGKETIVGRHYIMSLKLTVNEFAEAVWTHWSIENNLYWQLKVTSEEGQCRIRNGNADANYSLLGHQPVCQLKGESTPRAELKVDDSQPPGTTACSTSCLEHGRRVIAVVPSARLQRIRERNRTLNMRTILLIVQS